MSDRIMITPRQRQTYDAVYAVTEGGTVRWTGVLKVAGVDPRDAQSDLGRLANLKVLAWERIGNSRRLQVLVQPEGLGAAPPPTVKYQGKLHEGAVYRSGPKIPSGDDTGNGFRRDSGAFSRAFVAAFGPTASYGATIDLARRAA